METVLSARLKNVVCICLAGFLAAAAYYIKLLPLTRTAESIEVMLQKNSTGVEALLSTEINKNLLRSDMLFKRFKSGQLTVADLDKKEALISTENGVIDFYYGEIYFFKSLSMAEGEWRLIKKNQELYFFRRLGGRIHYLHFFMDMDSSLIRRAWKYPCAVFSLKYSPEPIDHDGSDFAFDQAQNRYYYNHILRTSQNQLVVNLIFSAADFSDYFKKRNGLLVYAALFFMFFAVLPVLRKPFWLPLPAMGGMAWAAWEFVAWLGKPNIHFPQSFMSPQSVWQLVIMLFFMILAGLRLARERSRPNNFLAFLSFNLLAGAVFYFSAFLLHGVDFPFAEFVLNCNYLGLLLLLIGLHALPFMVSSQFLKPVPWRRAWPLVALQGVVLFIYARFITFAIFNLFLLSVVFIVFLVSDRRFWQRTLLAALLTLSIGQFLVNTSQLEKEEFISSNLKNIFAAQDQYAKLVAREIVYEINSQQAQFSSLFKEGSGDELAKIWESTLAAREGIASGLYVLSQQGKLIHAFSHQIPYIDIKKKDIFPFWHVEAVEADLFGKKVNLALATINVFERERYIGYIMVQVLDSAELILRGYGQPSIFNLNQKIKAAGMSYLKVDAAGGILENPANINVENLAALIRTADSWNIFKAMGVVYYGYVFRNGDETVIIFYPKNTVFKTFSEFIKIMSVLLLAMVLFYAGPIRRFRWQLVFQSFSIKVFAILVLLSILTAAVFSMFSMNFNSQALETQQNRALYSRGRSALNIINNLLAESDEISQSHLFWLSKILENDISVYEKGILLYTSNHRKIIQSQLPIYLDSGIRSVLSQNNQQFFLQKKENLLGLYFKAADNYIFYIEFASNSANLIRSRQYYFDFMVSIFFILIVVGMAAAFFFRNKIVAPIHLLNRGMADVRQGRFRPLKDMPAEIELRELVQGFNAMLEGIKEQKKNVSEIARMKTLVELGRRVAHEVKNPLTPIKLSAEQIMRSLQDKDGDAEPVITSAVRYIIEETDHLRRVAYGFLNLSKLDELKTEPFLLDELITEAIAQISLLYPHVCFNVADMEAVKIVADRQKIKQVLDNVLTNALEAVADTHGRIDVSMVPQGAEVEVRIRDNGSGISVEELQRITNEEFSSKDLGTGLGLVIARRFLELHRGKLEIQSAAGQGTLVIMRFAKHAHQT
ncbi:MAG: HAMP domain-containing histidine kinase [Candidatus Aminicenantes bacterium]|nr:HAMP domain-containing histidine kinase [Candidatus Aminicenantes bacterium]